MAAYMAIHEEPATPLLSLHSHPHVSTSCGFLICYSEDSYPSALLVCGRSLVHDGIVAGKWVCPEEKHCGFGASAFGHFSEEAGLVDEPEEDQLMLQISLFS